MIHKSSAIVFMYEDFYCMKFIREKFTGCPKRFWEGVKLWTFLSSGQKTVQGGLDTQGKYNFITPSIYQNGKIKYQNFLNYNIFKDIYYRLPEIKCLGRKPTSVVDDALSLSLFLCSELR